MKTAALFRPDQMIAGVLFLVLAAIEASNDLNGVARAGLMPAANIVGWVIIPLWILSGAVLLTPRPISIRAHIVAGGIMAALMHGAFLRVGRTGTPGHSGGALFIVAAFLIALILLPTIRDWLAARGIVSANPRNYPLNEVP